MSEILTGMETVPKGMKLHVSGMENRDFTLKFTIHHIPRAIEGSAGLGLAVLTDIKISSWEGVHLISTSVLATLPPGTVDLIIEHSSNYKKNFEVDPGIVDSDTLGEIKVMVKALKETVQLHKGQRIAQLLLLPYILFVAIES
jgi:dUTPase